MTVYGKIENKILMSAPDGKVEDLISKGFSPFDDNLFSQCICGQISPEELVTKQENLIKKNDLQTQIDDLDKRRIRAIAEPSQKDENTTWLQFYNAQIQELRTQIAGL